MSAPSLHNDSGISPILRYQKTPKTLHKNLATHKTLSTGLIQRICAFLPQHTLTNVAQVSRQFCIHAQNALSVSWHINTQQRSAMKLLNTMLE
jgi:hypothetical protein